MIPNIPKLFRTIELYRHSIAVGLLLFCGIVFGAVHVFSLPVEWEAIYTIPGYVTIIAFFLSTGMIIVRDGWPFVRSLFGWDLCEDEKKQVATEILGASRMQSKERGKSLPFEVEVRDDEKKDFIRYNFEKTECRIDGDRVVVTEDGLEALKKYI